MPEPIDWAGNPVNALFRLIEFADNGEPLPPEMIKWLADGARDYLSGRSASVGRALGLESEKRGQPAALTRWRSEFAKGIALLWMSQLIDLGLDRKSAASLVRERMLREYKRSALNVATLMDSYSRSSWSKLQRRFGVGTEKMTRAEVVAYLAEFPHDRFQSQQAKKIILRLYPK